MENFKGHQIVKLGKRGWVFDITDFKGYYVILDRDNNPTKYRHAFTVETDIDNKISFNKFMRVPKDIEYRVVSVIEKHREEVRKLERNL